MRTALVALALLLAAPAWAAVTLVPGAAGTNQRSTGINGEGLDDTPVTDAIPHKAGETVVLNAFVTVGTTTDMTVSCEESPDGTNWSWVQECTGGASKTCETAVLNFDLDEPDVSIVVHGSQGYLRCTFDDAANGTGTIIVYGSIL